jgi:sugar/nucleoside kinase (ribokinase family)
MYKYDVYLYGMNLITTMHLLKNSYPEPDCYCEIKKTYTFPGGETGNCAIVLSGFGCNVKIDRTYLGTHTKDPFLNFFTDTSVDTSSLHFDETFSGLEDMVLIDKDSRTVFGRFETYFSEVGGQRWSNPREKDIEEAAIVGLDPFFYDESIAVAKYCHDLGKKYVTIDCAYDSVMHQYASATVISNEFIRNNYKDEKIEALYANYTAASDGLVIFTFGSKAIYYGRKNEPLQKMSPYLIEIESTLGAGDTFKAGVIYGILNNMADEDVVSFAAATAAVVCSHFPLALNVPKLQAVYDIQRRFNDKI